MKAKIELGKANLLRKRWRGLLCIAILCLSIFTAVFVSDRSITRAFQEPSKLVLTASPSKILTGGAYSWLTVQLQDANGNPALAPGDITVTLSTSDSSIVTLTATSFTIPAGSNYARSTWYYNRPQSGSPFAQSTFTPGTATITATATALTSSNLKITTSGAGGSPSKIFLFPQPSIILADKSSIAWLTIQLLDSSGNPSIAASATTIELSNSDPSIVTLSVTSVTISAGANYVTGYFDAYYGSRKGPYSTSTYKGGSVEVTASCPGLLSSSATIKTIGNAPLKVTITANPTSILTGGSISWLTVQLLDAHGNPALAPNDITISLSNSDPSIVTLSVTSVTISAGANYVTGYFDAYYGSRKGPYSTSTYTPGSATITASASGLTSGSVQIITSGAGGVPAKIVAMAQPTLIRADGRAYSWLTVQLKDASGKPSISPSDITVSLENSNPTAMALTATSFTIPAGSNYARSTWYYNRPQSGSPFVKSTLTPGTSTITASSSGLTSGTVTISSSELISLSVIVLNKNDQKQYIFNATDTTRIGADVIGVQLQSVAVTIKDPSGVTVVNNAKMTKVSGKTQYNYKYDYIYAGANTGKYYYVVTAKDAAGHTATKSGIFYIMNVTTTSDGPWTFLTGGYYNASFTISVQGAMAKKLALYVDLPYWHAIAFAELGGQPIDFSCTTSPYSQYRHFSVIFQNIMPGQTLQIKLTIIAASNAQSGSRTIYYHSEWKTTQYYPYSENMRSTTVLGTTISDVSDSPDPFKPEEKLGFMETTTISYTLSQMCHVTIRIYDSENTIIRVLEATQPAGANSMTWDGTDDQGNIAPDGTYIYEIQAVDMAGNEATPVTGTITVAS